MSKLYALTPRLASFFPSCRPGLAISPEIASSFCWGFLEPSPPWSFHNPPDRHLPFDPDSAVSILHCSCVTLVYLSDFSILPSAPRRQVLCLPLTVNPHFLLSTRPKKAFKWMNEWHLSHMPSNMTELCHRHMSFLSNYIDSSLKIRTDLYFLLHTFSPFWAQFKSTIGIQSIAVALNSAELHWIMQHTLLKTRKF